MEKPDVIFIGGPMGSGKSTVGKMLASTIKYEFVEGDDFHSNDMKNKMAAGIPLTGFFLIFKIKF
jgi:gluconokinase